MPLISPARTSLPGSAAAGADHAVSRIRTRGDQHPIPALAAPRWPPRSRCRRAALPDLLRRTAPIATMAMAIKVPAPILPWTPPARCRSRPAVLRPRTTSRQLRVSGCRALALRRHLMPRLGKTGCHAHRHHQSSPELPSAVRALKGPAAEAAWNRALRAFAVMRARLEQRRQLASRGARGEVGKRALHLPAVPVRPHEGKGGGRHPPPRKPHHRPPRFHHPFRTNNVYNVINQTK